MADFTDRINLIIDVTSDKATKGFQNIKQSVSEAEGGFGKLKAGAGAAIDSIAASPAAIGAAAIAAGKMALDLATGFEQAALKAQDFATASGLSVEQASRWQEVAGDLGVSTETLEGAVNKLNIAASKGALQELGIGGEDTNTKLLNALTHLRGIDDAAQRAKEGAQLFGKSWAQLAPLVEESGDLAANLAAVSDAKVIDEGEVRKAREMRDAMDKLSDTLDDIKLQLGEAFIGPITDVANIIGNVVDGLNTVKDATGGVADVMRMLPGAGIPDMLDGLSRATDFSAGWQEQLKGVGQTLTSNIPVIGGWASGLFGGSDAADEAAEATKRHNDALQIEAQAAKDAEAALDGLLSATLAQFNSQIGLEQAADKTAQSLEKYKTDADAANQSSWGNAEANKAAHDSMLDAESAALRQAAAAAKLQEDNAKLTGATWNAEDAARAQASVLETLAGQLGPDDPLRKQLLAYANQLRDIPKTAETTVEVQTKSAVDKVNELTAMLEALNGKSFFTQLKVIGDFSRAQQVAAAGTSTAPSAGATMAAAMLGGMMGAKALPRASSAPTTILNVNVTAAPLTHPAETGRQVADYLDAFYRRNGTRLRAVP